MSKKDYEIIAAALLGARKRTADIVPWGDYADGWRLSVLALADALARDNGRFDRGRFYAACGYEPAR